MLRCLAFASDASTAELVRYLARTSVGFLAPHLRDGTLDASNADVDPPALGQLPTIFKNLGDLYAAQIRGRRTFLVAEVREILNRPDCDAKCDLHSVEAFICAERKGQLFDRCLVAVEASVARKHWPTIAPTSGPMLVDGNKRASAIYETSLPSSDLRIPVFVLEEGRRR